MTQAADAGAEPDAGARLPSKAVDWKSLGFDFRRTNAYLRYSWSAETRAWSAGVSVREPYIQMHVCAASLNYGQQCFEGLKAFRCKDGRVRLFRPEENAARMIRSAERLGMVPPPADLFVSACYRAVKENIEFVPPCGSGASLYIRPLLLANGPTLGLVAAENFDFIVYVSPVAPFYSQQGVMKAMKAMIPEDFDRAAPLGTGSFKVGGNYAPAAEPGRRAKKEGYSVLLFLDSKTRTFVEEFSSANFLAVRHAGPGAYTVVAPESDSILPSITSKSVLELAATFPGWTVERRPVAWREVVDGGFDEVAAVGTAVILNPVSHIAYGSVTVKCGPENGLGKACQVLYDHILGIQTGDKEDVMGWMMPREGVAAWIG